MTAFVRSASLGNYAEVARRHGLDPPAMLREAKLNPAFLSNPDLRISTAAVVALLEESARRSRCPTFGLEMAESWRMSDFGALSLLLMHQPTLRDALTATIRYRHLLNDALSLAIEDAGALVIVREELVGEAAARSRQSIELAIGVVFRMFRALLGPSWHPRRVQFTHAAPPDLRVHRRIFGPKVEFNGDFNGIVCDAADLDRPNPGADPAMASHAQRFVDSLPGARAAGLVHDVRRSIYMLLPRGRASVEQIAQVLGTNPRALQRKLEESGESFTALLNDARRELVVRYLENPAYSVTQVGEMLGYNFPSSFTRWFVGQFGTSPARWRAGRAGGEASPG
ncbi:MAG TPA: AraC family transcriptional regulator [Usitatibacter sp.]|nr:AraC family transcriptional regulator [Usitatibacter sp.]